MYIHAFRRHAIATHFIQVHAVGPVAGEPCRTTTALVERRLFARQTLYA